ncbi:magnesium transporter CorA [Actinoplanes lobatus]|uniref:Magnesium transporter n=1 Tax=Actinoplanes lobatus TaxID=113568 RepID=A0A7W7H996_9ACTN|nr:magnesium transporter CorA family protein [Actinoplanes lobatus]MBB4746213.1 magnesium transporter [Actinoplanes lobatus]GGN61285.1 magnesium transporter CorA [Actinoplanes lobatus]GIE41421.1 magnesium transporter CorA [Actinoplanes lobatus]
MSSRLYVKGRLVAEGFDAAEAGARLGAEPGAVLWLDLVDPGPDRLRALAAEFELHPLAVEDAVTGHERPKLDHYHNHLFLNLYAVAFDDEVRKTEISAFITPRALITVRKPPSEVDLHLDRWDADERPAAGGVEFLVYGLLDAVVDGQYATAQRIDESMDGIEDRMIGEGAAPRDVRRRGFALRRTLAGLRRAVAPMPDVVREAGRALAADEHHLWPYYRDVEDHARRAVDLIEHSRNRITELLDDDLAEQSNALNDVTRKLAAWAAIIAIPTAITGYFGQNLPYPGYEKWWGFLVSTACIVLTGSGLYAYFKRRNWL